jgi:biotin transport system permease protein
MTGPRSFGWSGVLRDVPVGWKVFTLALSLGLAMIWPRPEFLLALGLVLICGHVLAGARRRQVAVPLFSGVISASFILGFHAIAGSLAVGVSAALTLLVAILGAVLFGVTTSSGALLDAITRWLGPLQRYGVDSERPAMLVAMAMRFIPYFSTQLLELSDARTARGASGWSVMLAAPLIVSALESSDALALALEARGFSPNFDDLEENL